MVQKKSIRMFWPVFLCCLLTACASNTGQPPLSTHTPSIQPSLTTPIATVTPTAYPSSTVTPTCTATPTQIPSITLYPTKETPSITPTLAPFPPVVNDLAYLASGQMAFISVGDNEKCGGLGVIDADGSNPKRYERPTVPVSIAWSPDGQWLAYEEFLYSMGHHEDIFLIQPNGTNYHRLTYTYLNMNSLDWSPDGQELLFSQDNYLVTVSKDRQNFNIIGNSGTSPIWSPNGTKIAYLKNDENQILPILFLYDLDLKTGILHKVSDTEILGDIGSKISWSPDGKLIAFISYKHVDYCGGLSLIGPDGKNIQAIGIDNLCASSPTWSPDGRYVAFLANPDAYSHTGTINTVPRRWEIYLFDLETHTIRQLTHDQSVFGDCDAFYLEWSPVPGLRIGKEYTITNLGDDLLLRPNPSLKGTQVEILKAGQKVTVLEGPVLAEGFYWRKVRAEDGVEGYVKEVGGWFLPAN